MDYQLTCPACRARLSRLDCYSTLGFDFQCRRCDARFRITAPGWIAVGVIAALEVLCYDLYGQGWLSANDATTLLLSVCGFGLWFLPYLTPVRLCGSDLSG